MLVLYYEDSASGNVNVSENNDVEVVAVRQSGAAEVVAIIACIKDSFAVSSKNLHLRLAILLQVGYYPAVIVPVAVGCQYVGYRNIYLLLQRR